MRIREGEVKGVLSRHRRGKNRRSGDETKLGNLWGEDGNDRGRAFRDNCELPLIGWSCFWRTFGAKVFIYLTSEVTVTYIFLILHLIYQRLQAIYIYIYIYFFHSMNGCCI